MRSQTLESMPLLNGAFDHFPDLTTRSTVGNIGVTWSLNSLGTAGAATLARVAFVFGVGGSNPPSFEGDPGGSLVNFLRWAQTTLATSQPELQNRIEHVRTLAGGQVVVNGWIRTDHNVQVGLRQSFGTGGGASADVDTELQTIAPSVDASGVAQWRRFQFTFKLGGMTGKTLGATANTSFLAVRFLGITGATFQYDLANINVADGFAEERSIRRPFWYEFELLKRYYWAAQLFAPVSTQSAMGYLFSRQMRIAPTVSGAGATHANVTADSASIISTGAAAAIPVVADARL